MDLGCASTSCWHESAVYRAALRRRYTLLYNMQKSRYLKFRRASAPQWRDQALHALVLMHSCLHVKWPARNLSNTLYPHESSCGQPFSRTKFSFRDRTFVRWIQWFSWFRTVVRLVLSIQLDLPAFFFFCIEILSRFGLRWCSVNQRLDFGPVSGMCRMAFWTCCSSRRQSIQFELAMDLILRLRIGRAAHQLFFIDVTVFMREQSEKREVRKSSITTEQETFQTVQTTRLGCRTDWSELHTQPATRANDMINRDSPVEQKLQ